MKECHIHPDDRGPPANYQVQALYLCQDSSCAVYTKLDLDRMSDVATASLRIASPSASSTSNDGLAERILLSTEAGVDCGVILEFPHVCRQTEGSGATVIGIVLILVRRVLKGILDTSWL